MEFLSLIQGQLPRRMASVVAQSPLLVAHCSEVAVLKFLGSFGEGALHSHLAPGCVNYAAILLPLAYPPIAGLRA